MHVIGVIKYACYHEPSHQGHHQRRDKQGQRTLENKTALSSGLSVLLLLISMVWNWLCNNSTSAKLNKSAWWYSEAISHRWNPNDVSTQNPPPRANLIFVWPLRRSAMDISYRHQVRQRAVDCLSNATTTPKIVREHKRLLKNNIGRSVLSDWVENVWFIKCRCFTYLEHMLPALEPKWLHPHSRPSVQKRSPTKIYLDGWMGEEIFYL